MTRAYLTVNVATLVLVALASIAQERVTYKMPPQAIAAHRTRRDAAFTSPPRPLVPNGCPSVSHSALIQVVGWRIVRPDRGGSMVPRHSHQEGPIG